MNKELSTKNRENKELAKKLLKCFETQHSEMENSDYAVQAETFNLLALADNIEEPQKLQL